MARCLVLGANGFIGSHLVDALVNAGHTVRVFDRFPDKKYKFLKTDSIDIFAGDFLNRHDLARALKDVEYLFHFISTTTPFSVENDPIIDIETNVKMTVELFRECVKQEVKKVIFASTGGAIYGIGNTDNIDEKVLPQPVSPYAIGKLTIEHYLRYFSKKHRLNSVVYRISNPYGERQSLAAKQGVIPIFLQHIARNEPITVLGDGSMVRDYIYVKDVADMIVESFENATKPVYNLGSGNGVGLNELVSLIRNAVEMPVVVEHKENLSTFVQSSVLDTSLFNNEFKIIPQTSLEQGIQNTWQYIKDQQKSQ